MNPDIAKEFGAASATFVVRSRFYFRSDISSGQSVRAVGLDARWLGT